MAKRRLTPLQVGITAQIMLFDAVGMHSVYRPYVLP